MSKKLIIAIVAVVLAVAIPVTAFVILGGKKEPGVYCVYSPEDEFLGIGEIDSEVTELSPKRVYRGE